MAKRKKGESRSPLPPPRLQPGQQRQSAYPEAEQLSGEATAALIAWLEKKKLPVPAQARLASAASVPYSGLWDLCVSTGLTSTLRERERRALERFCARLVKCGTSAADGSRGGSSGSGNSSSMVVDDPSSDEDVGSGAAPSLPALWPDNVRYSTEYEWSEAVPADVRHKYSAQGVDGQRLRGVCRKAHPRLIEIADHPACGERGLFATVQLSCGERVLDYIGLVSLGEDEDKTSDYVSEFGEKGELCCDANRLGNEARFVNDFRNTGRRPNVEFRLRRSSQGELRQGVYVCEARGIAPGEELLISYGKPFWKARVGDLSTFITRLPES